MRVGTSVTRIRLFAVLALMGVATLAACERRSGGADATTGDVLVGFYGSLTGDGASFGQSSLEGSQLAIEEINKAGGVLGGRQIKLLTEDDQSKPEEASNAVTKLITTDKVVAVLGEVASRRSLAAAPIAQKYQTPMITPASTNERVTQVGDYIFRVCFIDPFQGEVIAKYAYNELKARKAAVLTDIGQDYSTGLSKAVIDTFTKLGGQLIPTVNYSSGDSDFKAILTQVRSQKPDVIFATGYYSEAALIVRQARELGMKMPLLGGDGWVGDALANGREALNNTFISNHYSGDNPDPIVQTFVSSYRTKFKREPDSIAALGYDSVKVLVDALGRAKSTEGPKLREALASSDVPGVTGRLKMNPKRDVDKPAVIQEVTFADGQIKFVYKATVSPN
jgi:branched-chain amino acid transport system substrate-binding protein